MAAQQLSTRVKHCLVQQSLLYVINVFGTKGQVLEFWSHSDPADSSEDVKAHEVLCLRFKLGWDHRSLFVFFWVFKTDFRICTALLQVWPGLGKYSLAQTVCLRPVSVSYVGFFCGVPGVCPHEATEDSMVHKSLPVLLYGTDCCKVSTSR